MRSLFNSWLEPSAVGHFSREGTTEIRGALSIQDSPLGIQGATEPVPDDLVTFAQEYRIGPGDLLTVRMLDLLAVGMETPVQVPVDSVGNIRLPLIGRLQASGLTAAELEDELADVLAQREILRDAQVIVETTVRRGDTFTVFGIIAGPNIYPIPTPDFNLLQALNLAGGLSETVREIYVFRQEKAAAAPAPQAVAPQVESAEPELPVAPVHLYGGADGVGWGSSAQYVGAAVLGMEPPEDGRQPEDDERARQDLIEAILAPASAPVEAPSADTQPAVVAESEPAPVVERPPAQPRWVFLNGQWIEIEPEAAPQRGGEATPPVSPVPTVAQSPELPQPSIDWGEVAGEVQHRIIRVSADALRDGDARQNIVVRAGDVIRLSAGQSGEYYLAGQINRPGAYSLSGRNLTLKVAIASAGNLGALAWPERCTVYRRLGDREEMIQVNVDRIFSGEDPDFYVKKDDLIVFGTHPASLFLAVIRSAFRLTYGFGFVYDRNFADVDNVRRSTAASISAQRDAQPRFQGLLQ